MLQTIRGSSGLNSGAFPALGSALGQADGSWQFEESNLTGVQARFYRATVP